MAQPKRPARMALALPLLGLGARASRLCSQAAEEQKTWGGLVKAANICFPSCNCRALRDQS